MKTFDPDDPMLTAYALGELEGEELREVEELVARDPAAARHVESVRAAATEFGEAFEQEVAPAVEPIRAVEIEPQQRRPFTSFLYYASTATAACFFIVLAVRLANPDSDAPATKQAAEVSLPAAPADKREQVAGRAKAVRKRQEPDESRRLDASALADTAANERGAASNLARSRTEASEPAPEEFSKDDARVVAKRAAPAVAQSALPPPPPAAVGEIKVQSKDSVELDFSRDAAIDGDEIRLKPFSVIASGPETFKTVDAIRRALESGRKVTRIDIPVLLSDLGLDLRFSQEDKGQDPGNTGAQTTLETSPQPDPEAALARAVERFAELLSMNTPANNESWDRALADARYAAGDDPKRLAFVEVIELARTKARGPEQH